uniref:Uncharacterized protein n=1 Tax=Oryza punctata TaxID=4537 RepID=A0A0E0K9R6_ORYPU
MVAWARPLLHPHRGDQSPTGFPENVQLLVRRARERGVEGTHPEPATRGRVVGGRRTAEARGRRRSPSGRERVRGEGEMDKARASGHLGLEAVAEIAAVMGDGFAVIGSDVKEGAEDAERNINGPSSSRPSLTRQRVQRLDLEAAAGVAVCRSATGELACLPKQDKDDSETVIRGDESYSS